MVYQNSKKLKDEFIKAQEQYGLVESRVDFDTYARIYKKVRKENKLTIETYNQYLAQRVKHWFVR